eukprot:8818944-Karenia_brevis.AAC.1
MNYFVSVPTLPQSNLLLRRETEEPLNLLKRLRSELVQSIQAYLDPTLYSLRRGRRKRFVPGQLGQGNPCPQGRRGQPQRATSAWDGLGQ